MRKVVVDVKLRIRMTIDEGIEVQHVVNELDVELLDTTGCADVEDFEMTDSEVIDSK